MRTLIKDALPSNLIDEALHLYRNSTNQVVIDGIPGERYISGALGVFVLSFYSEEEFKNIWGHLKPLIEGSVGCEVDPYEFRILRYGTNGFIKSHNDSVVFDQSLNSKLISIIILLSSSNEGGDFVIDGEKCALNAGDLVLWTSEHSHEVRPVKQGIRYSINIRCLMVK